MNGISTRKGLFALSPIAVLLVVYLAGSIVTGSFYSIPIAVSFLVASVYAVAISRGKALQERIDDFSHGAANSRIMYMIWIFVFAGAFASVASATGAVDSTVALTLNLVPVKFLPAGIFVAACFVSMSVGTSVGTIVALAPIVTALAAPMGCNVAWLVAIVVGGAFFGDNLSFISDTTIAATQTQGCSMRSKFRTNLKLVMPAAIVTLLLYTFSAGGAADMEIPSVTFHDVVRCLPYLVVIAAALFGINVLTVLVVGVLVASTIGLAYGALGWVDVFTEMGKGISSMSELIIVTMLAGGLLELVRINGGLDYLIRIVTSRVRSRRGAEAAICMLTVLSNICTANNTIAILTVGDISRDIAHEFNIPARRSASLMDTTSCFVQGVIPYGAQLLMASGLAKVSPVDIISHLYYPMAVAIAVICSIVFTRNTAR